MIQFLADPTQHDNTLKMAVGFKEIDGKLWHFEKNGYASGVDAWFEAIRNGRKGWYYCAEEGVVATGFQTIGDERFYFAEKNSPAIFTDGKVREVGELVHGTWFQIPAGERCGWYRADTDGQLNRGLLPFGTNERYFFDKKSGKSLFSIRQSGEKRYGYAPGKVTQLLSGFHSDHEGNRYYFGVSGDGVTSLAVGELAQDWFHIKTAADAGWYYADKEGVINTKVLEERDLSRYERYFFDKDTGKSLFSIRAENNKIYGFGPGSCEVTSKVEGFYGDTHGNDYYFGVKGDGLSTLAVSELATGGPYTLNGKKFFFDVKSGKSLGLRIFLKGDVCLMTRTDGEELKGTQTIAINIQNSYFPEGYAKEIGLENGRVDSKFYAYFGGAIMFGEFNVVKGIEDDDSLYVEQLYGVVSASLEVYSDVLSPPGYYFDPKHPDAGVNEGQKAINQDIHVDGKVYKVVGGAVEGYSGVVTVDGLKCFFEKGRSIKKPNYWYQEDDGTFYHYNTSLTHDTGWFDNGKYYLGSSGDGTDLKEGQLATSWRQINHKWYYFGDYHDLSKLPHGELAQGFCVIGSNTYYFGEKNPENASALTAGEMATGWQTFAAGVYYFGTPDDETLDDGVMAESFHAVKNKETNKEEQYYFATRNDAKKTVGTKVVSWHRLLGDWFYFDTRGVMMTGWQVLGDKTYYLGAGDDNRDTNYGVMVSGWHHIGDKKFYFGVPGDQTNLGEGQLAVGQYTIAGKQYYFAESADTATETIKGEMATGWQQRGSQHFYYGSNEEMSSLELGQMAQWTTIIGDKHHYFSTDGSAYCYEGNCWLKNYNAEGEPVTWYLLEKSAMATGWQTIDGRKYYFGCAARQVGMAQKEETDGSGLSVGEIAIGFKQIDGDLYYFAPADFTNEIGITFARGECVSSWFQTGGETYYADPKSGVLNCSVLNINGLRYFFNKKGCSLFCIDDEGGGTGSGPGSDRNNKLINAIAYDGNGTGYCFDASAKVRRGWYHVTAPVKGRVYGGTPGDGTTLGDYQLATGFQTIEGKLYHFNEKGLMSTGWFMVGSSWYRYDERSDQVNRGVLKWDGNQHYHFDPLTGKFLYMFMVGTDGSYTAYHYDAPSYYKKFSQSGWTADRQYYLDDDMKVVTGWRKIEDKYYYFCKEKENYGKIETGFQLIEGKQYYLGAVGDGSGLNEGQMAVYSVFINDRMHYFQGDGVAWPDKTWLKDWNNSPVKNTWYILEKGECAFGWESIDGLDYYFNPHNSYRLDS